jgi:hypothetical protein
VRVKHQTGFGEKSQKDELITTIPRGSTKSQSCRIITHHPTIGNSSPTIQSSDPGQSRISKQPPRRSPSFPFPKGSLAPLHLDHHPTPPQPGPEDPVRVIGPPFSSLAVAPSLRKVSPRQAAVSRGLGKLTHGHPLLRPRQFALARVWGGGERRLHQGEVVAEFGEEGAGEGDRGEVGDGPDGCLEEGLGGAGVGGGAGGAVGLAVVVRVNLDFGGAVGVVGPGEVGEVFGEVPD